MYGDHMVSTTGSAPCAFFVVFVQYVGVTVSDNTGIHMFSSTPALIAACSSLTRDRKSIRPPLPLSTSSTEQAEVKFLFISLTG